MTNASPPSDPDEYVIRSVVRAGHKRELAFALKSQAELSLSASRSRTRSGKSSLPVPKRIRKSKILVSPAVKSDGQDSPTSKLTSLDTLVDIDDAKSEASMEVDEISGCVETEKTGESLGSDQITGEDSARKLIVFDDMKSDGHVPKAEPAMEAGPIEMGKMGENLMDLGTKEKTEEDSEAKLGLLDHVEIPPLVVADSPGRRLTRSALKLTALLKPAEDPMEVVEIKDKGSKPESGSIEIENTGEILMDLVPKESTNDSEAKLGENLIDSALKLTVLDSMATAPPPDAKPEGTPGRRLTRSASKLATQPQPAVDGTIVAYDPQSAMEKLPVKYRRLAKKVLKENILIGPEKAGRRSTRSLMKEMAVEEPVAGGEDSVASGEDSRGGNGGDDGSSSLTPGKKMELKMSKKIALHKLPTNVRELLNTGLLEGLPVTYDVSAGKKIGLEGMIIGNGILCSCDQCQGTKVISTYNFELHAGSTKKHPSDFIFLSNGKSLRDILEDCRSAPLDMLEAAIQNSIGPLPQSKPSTCQSCQRSFLTPRDGKFGLLCDSCLVPKKQLTTPAQGTPNKGKLSGQLSSALDGPSSSRSSTKRNSTSTKFLLEGPADVSSKNMSSQKKTVQGKITRKDLGLHKLVFMDDILPEGTAVGYYVGGKKLRDGYIKDGGIFCLCCETVVSPSQFEAHAGRASRRKPYNNIYTSNGVSLHELSVSLSKGRKLSSNQNDDLCSICADGGDLILCDLCPRVFHKECAGLSSVPKGDWYCRYCHDMHEREKAVEYNDNAIAAGRVAGVDPIEQIIKRCIRIVTTSNDFGVCVLCRLHDFSKSGFDERTVMICDQCEKEYHVGCMKDNDMCDLKELPEGDWFCSDGCSGIHAALHMALLREPELLPDLRTKIITKKRTGKGLNEEASEVRWRLLSGKASSDDTKLLLSEAVSIFHESFDPIVDAVTGRDLIPSMVYGRSVRDQEYGGMYCAVLTVNSSVVSAGIIRVLGSDVAELPLVATSRESQGQGYFQSLFSCIEKMLIDLKVKHFVLPAAEEAESIWTKKFGFSRISKEQMNEYSKGARPLVFQGTSLLHKLVPV